MPPRRLVSKEIKSFLKLSLCFFILAVFFRLVFFLLFKSSSDLPYTANEAIKAFYIGFKFDLRAGILLSLPFWFFGYSLKLVNAIFEEDGRKMFLPKELHPTTFLKLAFSLILTAYSFFFLVDLGHYEYLKNRINASSFTVFLKNPLINFQMISESYHMTLIVFLAFLVFVLFFFILNKVIFTEKLFVSGEPIFNTSFKIILPLFLALTLFSHGKLSKRPLRWSDAHFSPNNFISALGVNPLLYFYDTLNFNRAIKTTHDFDEPPNVAIIMMESLAAFKLQHFGQTISATPFLNSLIPQGLFFENAFVTSTRTARSIFGVLTGLPDVNSIKTASRNPLLVKQYSAANAFTHYNKPYFIGGSAN